MPHAREEPAGKRQKHGAEHNTAPECAPRKHKRLGHAPFKAEKQRRARDTKQKMVRRGERGKRQADAGEDRSAIVRASERANSPRKYSGDHCIETMCRFAMPCPK